MCFLNVLFSNYLEFRTKDKVLKLSDSVNWIELRRFVVAIDLQLQVLFYRYEGSRDQSCVQLQMN
jgi:hypothetical protein